MRSPSAIANTRTTGPSRLRAWSAACLLTLSAAACSAELCTTQSQMTPAVRDSIAAAAQTMAQKIQGNDTEALKLQTVPEYARDFGGIAYVVGTTAPQVKAATLTVDQVYLLDGSTIRKQPDGTTPDAQFFCSLNRSPAETDFVIPNLPAGRYAFAMVQAESQTPWRLSFLLRQENNQWLLAGLFPQPETAAGHDGLWYWKDARTLVAAREPWNAWVFYQQAQSLLRPAAFVQSTHLEKLRAEQSKAAPPQLSEGIGPDTPLVVKGTGGVEYRFTSLDTNESVAGDRIDLAVHLKADPLADPVAARKRNVDAAAALLAAYPEMRKPFHGVWVYADTGGSSPFATEQAMTEIP